MKNLIKISWLSVIFSGTYFISKFAIENSNICGHLHAPISVGCDIAYSVVNYVALIAGAIFGWQQEFQRVFLVIFIPTPLLIYDLYLKYSKNMFSQIRPEILDHIQHHFFQYSLPCLIVAIAISLATRSSANAP